MDVTTLHLVLVFALVAGVFVAFIREWMSPDLVALSAAALVLAAGILTTDQVLSVFSNSAPITVACMFVLSAALERTGVIDSIGRLFTRIAGASEFRALLALTVMAATLSAFINNTQSSWSSCR